MSDGPHADARPSRMVPGSRCRGAQLGFLQTRCCAAAGSLLTRADRPPSFLPRLPLSASRPQNAKKRKPRETPSARHSGRHRPFRLLGGRGDTWPCFAGSETPVGVPKRDSVHMAGGGRKWKRAQTRAAARVDLDGEPRHRAAAVVPWIVQLCGRPGRASPRGRAWARDRFLGAGPWGGLGGSDGAAPGMSSEPPGLTQTIPSVSCAFYRRGK